jgi:hypothetical protein
MSRNILDRKVLRLAQRLLAFEVARNDVAEASMPALALVAEAMRGHIVTVIGIAGFRSLLGRALTIAEGQVPGLSTVHIEPDGSLALEGFNDQAREDQAAEGSTVLIAEFLGLLVTFIGESLMVTLVRNAWPDLPVLNDDTLEKSDDGPTR